MRISSTFLWEEALASALRTHGKNPRNAATFPAVPCGTSDRALRMIRHKSALVRTAHWVFRQDVIRNVGLYAAHGRCGVADFYGTSAPVYD